MFNINDSLIDMYSAACSVNADVSALVHTLAPEIGKNGKKYLWVDAEIVLLFGLTELKAQICWKENVRLFPVLIILSLTSTPYRARKNGEVILTSCFILLIVCSLKGSSYYCVR
jgi:hypothetical protein